MSDPHEPAPLPPEVASLLASERAREPADGARVERLLRRFEVARDVRDDPSPPDAPRAVPRAGWRRDLLVLAAGAALGAGAHALVARRPPPVVVTRTVRVPQAVERVVTAPPPPQPPTPPDAGAPQPSGEAPRRGHGAPRDDADGALAAERAALEIARTALSRGQAQAALDALSRYERRYHGGALGEERASLWVIALARAGRTAEARARAASFRRRWPESYLLPAVEAALE